MCLLSSSSKRGIKFNKLTWSEPINPSYNKSKPELKQVKVKRSCLGNLFEPSDFRSERTESSVLE